MPKIKSLLYFGLLLISTNLVAQDTDTTTETDNTLIDLLAEEPESDIDTDPYVHETYKSTRIINSVSNELIAPKTMDFKIDHHFGDFGGEQGGVSTFFGMDNAADIRIGFDFGVTERLNLGIARYKGVGAQTQLYELAGKFALLRQKKNNKMPLSILIYGTAVCASNTKAASPGTINYYSTFADRMSYNLQAVISRKFNSNFSLSMMPIWVHNNLVDASELNNAFAWGFGFRYKLGRRWGLIGDYFVSLNRSGRPSDYRNPLALGVEIETGGHVFHVTFMNNRALAETQFIPNCTQNWADGQFRWGFKISRLFNL